MTYQQVANSFDWASKICTVLVAAAVVFSTSATVILFPLAILFTLAAGDIKRKISLILYNPITWAMVAFFLLHSIGAIYSTAPAYDVWVELRKYIKFTLMFMLIPIFIERCWRNYAINAFLIAVLVSLIASYLNAYGWLSYGVTGPIEVFRISMVFNFLMAFGAYLCLIKIVTPSRYRWMWILFFVLLVHTVLFRSIGRSGYAVFIGLMGLFFVQKLGWRGLVVATISTILLCGLAFNFSVTFKERINVAINDIKTFSHDNNTSVGLRMTFVLNGIRLIKAHPFFGTGTGSYSTEYTEIKPIANERNLIEVLNSHGEFTDPHNEYIYVMVQFGLLGLMVLLGFFAVPLWYSQFLPETEKYIARGMVISVMIGSLANSWLLDVTVRYCYVYFVVLAFAALEASRTCKRSLQNC